jgi:hypothetical protein
MHMHMHMHNAHAHAYAHARAYMHMHMHMHTCTCACKAKLERLQQLQGAKATMAKRSARGSELAGTQSEALPPPADAQAKLKALPRRVCWASLPTQGVLEFVYAHVQLLSAPADGAATAGGSAVAGGGASAPSRPSLKRPPLKRPTAPVAAPVTPLMGDDDLAQVLGEALAEPYPLIPSPSPS